MSKYCPNCGSPNPEDSFFCGECGGKFFNKSDFSKDKNNSNYNDLCPLFSAGLTLLELGRYAEAITCFDKGIKLDPESLADWLGKGYALHELGRYAEAETCFDKIFKINPNFIDALSLKGIALSRQGRHLEALTYIDKALEISSPGSIGMWLGKRIALTGLGRNAEAKKCYEEAKRLGYKGK